MPLQLAFKFSVPTIFQICKFCAKIGGPYENKKIMHKRDFFMTIALIGPPGAGKGTQATKLITRFDLLHISTGDLFRESLEKRWALGLLARRYMNQGELVPDEIVGAMIEEWLWRVMPGKRILFDGFPSTTYQAKILDKLFNENDRHLEAVFYLKVPDEEIIRRLPGRVICRVCQRPYHREFKPPAVQGSCDLCRGELYQRDDDSPAIVRTRLKTSHRVLEPLVAYYKEMGNLIIVDGAGEIDQVYQTIATAIDGLRRRQVKPVTEEEVAQIRALKKDVTALAPNQAAHRSLDILLLGGPGSGKGTQAEQLRNRLNLRHISTGELFRENIKNQTDLGKLAKTYINRGELVPDDVTEAMVKERISRADTHNGFILDGFPRTIPQAEALTEIMTNIQRAMNAVVHIKVSDENIVARLSGRRICRECQASYHLQFKSPQTDGVCDLCQGELYQREDDNSETIKARLKTYKAQTAPLIDHYRQVGILIEINGEQDVSDVTENIIATLQALDNV